MHSNALDHGLVDIDLRGSLGAGQAAWNLFHLRGHQAGQFNLVFWSAAICLGGVDEPDGTWIDALLGPDVGAVSRSAIVVWNKPLDCNTNNIPDPLEILMNPLLDGNGDGRIDICPPPPPINPDLNGDGFVNGADLTILLINYNGFGPAGDINHDGVVDGLDLTYLLSSWGTTGGDP